MSDCKGKDGLIFLLVPNFEPILYVHLIYCTYKHHSYSQRIRPRLENNVKAKQPNPKNREGVERGSIGEVSN